MCVRVCALAGRSKVLSLRSRRKHDSLSLFFIIVHLDILALCLTMLKNSSKAHMTLSLCPKWSSHRWDLSLGNRIKPDNLASGWGNNSKPQFAASDAAKCERAYYPKAIAYLIPFALWLNFFFKLFYIVLTINNFFLFQVLYHDYTLRINCLLWILDWSSKHSWYPSCKQLVHPQG